MTGKIFGCVFCDASGTFSTINQHIRNIYQQTKTSRNCRTQHLHSPEVARAVAHATTPEPAFINEVSPERITVLTALTKLIVRQLTGEADVAAWGKRNIQKYSAGWWAEQVDIAVLRFRDSGSNHDVPEAHFRSVVENAVDSSLRRRDEALPRAVRAQRSTADTSPLASSTYLTIQDGYSTFGTGSANTYGACPTRGTGSTNTFGACPTSGTGTASTFKGPSMGDRNRLREQKRTYLDLTESTDEGSDSEVSALRYRGSGSNRDVLEGHLRSVVESAVDDPLLPNDEALPRAVRPQRSTTCSSPLPSSTYLRMQDGYSLDTGSTNTYGACPTRGTGSTNTFGACQTRDTGTASTFKGPSMGDRNRIRENKRIYIDLAEPIDEGSDSEVSAPPPAKSRTTAVAPRSRPHHRVASAGPSSRAAKFEAGPVDQSVVLNVCGINNRVEAISVPFGTTLEDALARAYELSPAWLREQHRSVSLQGRRGCRWEGELPQWRWEAMMASSVGGGVVVDLRLVVDG